MLVAKDHTEKMVNVFFVREVSLRQQLVTMDVQSEVLEPRMIYLELTIGHFVKFAQKGHIIHIWDLLTDINVQQTLIENSFQLTIQHLMQSRK